MQEGLQIKVGADVNQAVTGINKLNDALKTNSVAVEQTAVTWKQFVSERMGSYMKEFGGHGPAIKKIGEEWQAYKAQLSTVGAATSKVIPPISGLGEGLSGLGEGLKKIPKNANGANLALINFGRVVQDAPFGIIGITNNINPLLESFQRLKAESGSTKAALTGLISGLAGPAGLGVAVSIITSLLTVWAMNNRGVAKSTEDIKKESDKYAESIKQISSELSTEFVKVGQIVYALENMNLSRKQQIKLIDELNKLAPGFFSNLDTEKNLVDKLAISYFAYKNSITQAFQTKLKEKEFKSVSDELLKIEEQINRINGKSDLSRLLGKTVQSNRTALVDEKGNLITLESLYRDRNILQKVFASLQKDINIGTNDYVAALITGAKETTKTQKESIKTDKDLILGKVEINGALEESIRLTIQQKEEQKRLNAEILKNLPKNLPGSQLPDRLSGNAGLGGLNFDRSQRGIEPSNIIKSTEAASNLKKQLVDIGNTIKHSINGGIETFFNAIANNQDPFKALVQSVKRLVVELSAAVVKALILKAITAAANVAVPGSGALIGLTGGALRGSAIALSLLRTAGG